jgi:hypothetical protein
MRGLVRSYVTLAIDPRKGTQSGPIGKIGIRFGSLRALGLIFTFLAIRLYTWANF